jgi:predicted ester cyclase
VDDEMRSVLDRLAAAIRSNDPERIAELYTEDCVIADPAMEVTGRDNLVTAASYFHRAFEVLEIALEDPIVEGSRVAGRTRWRAIHKGEYLGIPATNREFESWNLGVLEIRDGLIASDNNVWDVGEYLRLKALAEEGDA